MNSVDVSIIMVNWNTRELLYNCINSVYRNTSNSNFGIIVIDNASSDDSDDMLKLEFGDVKVIANTENRGFAAANNQGMLASKGRYILLLNSDTIVLDNAIDKAVAFADAHKQAAVVGPRVLNPDNTLQLTCFMFPSILNMLLSASYLYKLFPKSRFFGRERMTWWSRDDVREVDVVTGCFMLVRREAIEAVGMMDERFFMYGEETDWCYRFKQAGWKVMFTPMSTIIHLGGQSSRKAKTEMMIRLRLSILQFIDKHYSWLKHKTAWLLIMLFFAVRIPVWFFVSISGMQCRRKAAVKLRAYTNGIRQMLLNSTYTPEERMPT
jgi:GT2 family glycosyltransferase